MGKNKNKQTNKNSKPQPKKTEPVKEEVKIEEPVIIDTKVYSYETMTQEEFTKGCDMPEFPKLETIPPMTEWFA